MSQTNQRAGTLRAESTYDVGAYEFNVGSTPTAKLSVLNLDFGDLGVGVAGSQTITLTNTGTGGLALSALDVSGADILDFAVTPAAGCAIPVTVAASQACAYTVTFTPALLGQRTAALAFTDDTLNAPGSTQTVALVGNGIRIGTTTTSLALTGGASPATFGASLTFTAAVTPSAATGIVNFFDSGTSIGAVELSGGSGALTISSLAVGSHSITAQYMGDTFDGASTSSAVEQVVTAGGISLCPQIHRLRRLLPAAALPLLSRSRHRMVSASPSTFFVPGYPPGRSAALRLPRLRSAIRSRPARSPSRRRLLPHRDCTRLKMGAPFLRPVSARPQFSADCFGSRGSAAGRTLRPEGDGGWC